MRKTKKGKLFEAIRIALLTLAVWSLLPTFWHLQEMNYYRHKEYYITAVGTIDRIRYDEKNTRVILDFSEILPEMFYPSFDIVGESFLLVQSRGIEEKLKLGDQVEIVTAPGAFSYGYVRPIVAISINGESLLDFDEGYANLIRWYRGLHDIWYTG